MDARLYAPGEEVTVKVASQSPPGRVITYSGIVVPGKSPGAFLYLSVGSRLLEIPWERVSLPRERK